MARHVRFFRWYRTLPILAMVLVAVLCFGMQSLPADLARRFLFQMEHQQEILDSSSRHGVDPLLVCAVIDCESNWEEAATSEAGAVGLMQLMPDTSAEMASFGLVDMWSYDPANLTDPATNIEYGCAYLGWLSRQLSSTDEVIAAYNAGPGAVESWLSSGGDVADAIDIPETALYLVRVNETYDRYQQLYTETLSER